VTVIPANPRLNKYTGNVEGKILNVCAYARVSTDDEDQLNSFEAQKEYYTEKIQSNPKWRFAGIFPDKGLTGTSLDKRDEFNKMMRICKRGKINLILWLGQEYGGRDQHGTRIEIARHRGLL
jgi:site-specific DNA recombinase